jgi:hypothetical protein
VTELEAEPPGAEAEAEAETSPPGALAESVGPWPAAPWAASESAEAEAESAGAASPAPPWEREKSQPGTEPATQWLRTVNSVHLLVARSQVPLWHWVPPCYGRGQRRKTDERDGTHAVGAARGDAVGEATLLAGVQSTSGSGAKGGLTFSGLQAAPLGSSDPSGGQRHNALTDYALVIVLQRA